MVRAGYGGRPIDCMQANLLPIERLLLLAAVSLLAMGGCGKKQDVKTETSNLEKAFAAPGAPSQDDPVQNCINAAMTAIKSNDYPAALSALDALRKQKGLTASQRMAVNSAAGQIEADLVRRAAAGDQKAKAALDGMRQVGDQR
jgi:hypothetical protein